MEIKNYRAPVPLDTENQTTMRGAMRSENDRSIALHDRRDPRRPTDGGNASRPEVVVL
jgi:hypothetical protein